MFSLGFGLNVIILFTVVNDLFGSIILFRDYSNFVLIAGALIATYIELFILFAVACYHLSFFFFFFFAIMTV